MIEILNNKITSKFNWNEYNTTDLTLSVMSTVARILELDIYDNDTADRLYDICCSLESWDPDHGFGSSDHYGYIQSAREEFNLQEGGA